MFLALPLSPPLAPTRVTSPLVVELFTSEGCSSCPSADALLARYAGEGDVLLLSEHVDYWDRLGWKDRFASPAFSARQEAYARRFRLDSVYTPQAVVDGESQFVGSDEGALRRSLAAPRAKTAVALAREGNGWRVETIPTRAPADVVIAVVLPRAATRVSRGENAGRTLVHLGVVRELRLLGPAGRAYGVPSPPAGTSLVAFVQERGFGRILGAARP